MLIISDDTDSNSDDSDSNSDDTDSNSGCSSNVVDDNLSIYLS